MKNFLLTGVATMVLVACTTDKTPPTEIQAISREEAVGLPSPQRMSNALAASPAMVTPPPEMQDTSRFDNGDDNPVKLVSEEPVSTFSADVDTASYSVMRRQLNRGQLPASEAIRTEELINYFDYDYAQGTKEEPFKPSVWVTPTPWSDKTELMHMGVKGYDVQPTEEPDANIVLLLDVSGSMSADDKLPLLKKAMGVLVDQLDEDDRVSIVTYAGRTGVVLKPTPGSKKREIMAALDILGAAGSTAGAAGLSLAYSLAEENFDEDKVNRIILATDGDFNIGISSDESLEDLVVRQRDKGIYLSVLGFGMYNLNDQMMQRIAQNGNGVAAYIDTLDEARKVLGREFKSSVFPIAEDLKFQIEFNQAQVSEYRLIGYQTRILDREDFNNDQVDAGDIGSGHTVTALYEITRAGQTGMIDPLRYDDAAVKPDPSAELAFLKIRYKAPGEDESTLRTKAIQPSVVLDSLEAAPDDVRFAAAVAAMGEKLSGTGHADDYPWADLIDLALGARGNDPYGDRVGFVNLARAAAKLSGQEAD
ncbi:VWA domain-containing protein [Parvularcula sp. LCG005]|uniref:vWA domain-containing protein n=1 Tax=Parvularcula sp. LCG005 TaxID=3078805 RepID=UPI002942F3FC|nr:VWA domain-containing protein [Parvularcula sp. LCG005]WOI54205.1 VWA domain-containing protein [Parvularcula sp. LCG005]